MDMILILILPPRTEEFIYSIGMMERSSERNVEVFGNMVILFRKNINLWEYIEYKKKNLEEKKGKRSQQQREIEYCTGRSSKEIRKIGRVISQ